MKHFIVKPEDVIKVTFLAILISFNGKEVWLPKSVIIMSVDTGGFLHILIPEWMCDKKGI